MKKFSYSKRKRLRIRHRQRSLFLKQLRRHPQKKKKNVLPKSKAEGPRRFERRIISNQCIAISRLNRSQKIEKRFELVRKMRLDTMLDFLLKDSQSPFNLEDIYKSKYKSTGTLEVPKDFSVITNPSKSFLLLRRVVSVLFLENGNELELDYKDCHHVELGTQVLLDIILTSFDKFIDRLKKRQKSYYQLFAKNIGGKNINDIRVRKLIFSVGSPVSLNVTSQNFPDVEKSTLIRHPENRVSSNLSPAEQNEIETTILMEYVINCMNKIHRELSDDQKESLSCIIGEILINAEEHSSTNNRFSIGYFLKEDKDGRQSGMFRLVIMNLGVSIYEKFKNKDCPNQGVVKKMEALSKKYTQKHLFSPSKFNEGCLWTLYALQEGISSVMQKDRKRGNGSIRFIDSFFKIKGEEGSDGKSRMNIISGNTIITFDGSYAIQSKENENGEKFSVMTFNESGNIEDAPDSDYVRYCDFHFPGTMISVSLNLNEIKN